MTKAFVASPLGFLIGFSMGALGGGGSILAVPVLVYVVGQSPPAATTTSLVVVGLAALVGMGERWRAGRVRPGIGVVFGLAGIGGSIAGSALNRDLDPTCSCSPSPHWSSWPPGACSRATRAAPTSGRTKL